MRACYKPRTNLLGLMGVQVDDLVMLAAHKIEGGARAPSHNANALRPGQHLLQLWHIPLVDLHCIPSICVHMGEYRDGNTKNENYVNENIIISTRVSC